MSSLQSNHEGQLVEWVHEHQDELDGTMINPAGLASYGYPLLDALRGTGHPFAVVHISRWHVHDGTERTDIFAHSAAVYLTGAGWRGYSLTLNALVHQVRDR